MGWLANGEKEDVPRTEATKSTPALHYERAGDAGPAVLLVMGLGMQGRVWDPQVRDLCADHRVAFFDNRGIGKSDALSGRPTILDFASDALRVADACGFSQFHVVGVSLGGMIAQEIALSAKERVTSLTLIATHAGGPFGLTPRLAGLVAFARSFAGPRSQRIRALQDLLYPKEFLATVDQAKLDARMKLQVGERAAPRTMVGQLFAVVRHDTRRRLDGIVAPTLVIRPDRDILVRPTHSNHLARGIRRSTLLSVPDAGHGVTFQGAELVSDAIRKHVAETERSLS